ncbi:hypothetical protein [Collimonas silvisoli]|uniref:hypothetical protein n=1 Tax=Collimonas silvisoli TaxID=2825884 RepID=UPI001B8BCC44|nr:hypothetical protein [Collimonas silvisoli]
MLIDFVMKSGPLFHFLLPAVMRQIARSKRTRIQPTDAASQPDTSSWQKEDFFIGIGGSFS